MMRMAISPRLAMSTFLNMESLLGCGKGASARLPERGSDLLQLEQLLTELHTRTVFDQHFENRAGVFGLDLVHQLHGLDDAKGLTRFHHVADFDEGPAVWRR